MPCTGARCASLQHARPVLIPLHECLLFACRKRSRGSKGQISRASFSRVLHLPRSERSGVGLCAVWPSTWSEVTAPVLAFRFRPVSSLRAGPSRSDFEGICYLGTLASKIFACGAARGPIFRLSHLIVIALWSQTRYHTLALALSRRAS